MANLIQHKRFTVKGKLLVFIAIIIITGLPWWLTGYTTYLNNPIFSIISICLLASIGGYLKAKSNHSNSELIWACLGGHQLAFIIKIYIDSIPDPTNHNLAPFEMLIFLFIDTIACFIVMSIVEPLKTKK